MNIQTFRVQREINSLFLHYMAGHLKLSLSHPTILLTKLPSCFIFAHVSPNKEQKLFQIPHACFLGVTG
jgi:hypothetical protein